MKFTIKARLFLGFGILTVIFVTLGIYATTSLGTVNNQTVQIAENWLPSVNYAHSINTATSDFRIKELEHVIAETPEQMNELEKEMDLINNEIKKHIEGYDTVITNEVDQKIISSIRSEWDKYLQIHEEFLPLSRALKTQEAMSLLNGESKKVFDDASSLAVELVEFNQDGAGESSKDANAVYSSTRSILIVIIAIAIIICIGASLIITGSIVRPVNKLIDVADKLALGDVTVKVEATTKDEIGNLMQAFGRMIENIRGQAMAAERIAAGDLTVEVAVKSDNDLLGKKLSEMVRKNNQVLTDISSASEQVAGGAKQVSDSSIALSQGATEQASTIEELTASLEEISSQTKLNAENADQANGLAESAKSNAVLGNQQMGQMLNAMEEINDASSNISKIIKVIDEIAFQTNILALNAAVEAARAGQHGKGFAVVAEEVRNLAARSANAAKETTDMIEGSIKKVEGGTKIARETAEALNKIVGSIERVATLVNDIAVASNEQASGIAQINQGVMQISQVVQTNSSTSEESAAASEELSGQAALLREMVSRFKLRKTSQSYNKLEDIDPEMAKMLESMAEKRKGVGNIAEEAYGEAAISKSKITLSDKEFGKYS
ncbi:methyl-accepting chemotaxis protein [Petroclostridium sp. X23]|uniref:methyl-accepting chemotaxis protein n=1 Tax=Petroclostridium sp. X23 TaxID=3045146 RepID=UPI0024ADEFAF|nr:methyl-accepting chemotaxis protein [Petroclostridium sp. X23]WHH61092.1 methyl-accepting chemotaxis protein [Petroclostridium sp. X23]